MPWPWKTRQAVNNIQCSDPRSVVPYISANKGEYFVELRNNNDQCTYVCQVLLEILKISCLLPRFFTSVS